MRWISSAFRAATRLAVVLTAAASTSGCLVLALHPSYDDASLAWDPALVGTWLNEEDRVTVAIARGEWRSYRIEYEHPIEKGRLTGYLTAVDDRYYLDVSPLRGEDHGSFLVPVHAILRLERAGDTITVQALDYDRFALAAKKGGLQGLALTLDQKQNALVTEETAGLRRWLRRSATGAEAWFGARAVFKRNSLPDNGGDGGGGLTTEERGQRRGLRFPRFSVVNPFPPYSPLTARLVRCVRSKDASGGG